MRNLKIKLLVFSFAFLFFILFSFNVYAQEKRGNSSITKVSYELTWPGMLPDHKLYKLKVVRDKIVEKLVANPVRKIEYSLLQSDKYIAASKMLFDKGNKILAKETALKGEHYYTKMVSDYKWAYWYKRDIPKNLRKKIELAPLKHQEIFAEMMTKSSAEDKSLYKQLIKFSKGNYNSILEVESTKSAKLKN